MRMALYASLLMLPLGCSSSVPVAKSGVGGAEDEVRTPEVKIDTDAQEVVRKDAEGNVRWTTKLDGRLSSVRPPDILWDSERVYVSHKEGVTALDATTGKILWHSEGPHYGLLLSNDLLLATGSTPVEGAARDCFLVARSVADGKETFRVPVEVDAFDPLAVEELAGLFAVQSHEAPGGVGDANLIDRKGVIRHRFKRQVIAGIKEGDDRLFLTSTDVIRKSSDDKTRWTVPFERHQWLGGGELIKLAAGDILAFRYGRINDSGADLVCISPEGKVVWAAHCANLGVTHSKYRHTVAVAVERDTLRIASRGSQGTFVELLDLASGRQLKRVVKKVE